MRLPPAKNAPFGGADPLAQLQGVVSRVAKATAWITDSSSTWYRAAANPLRVLDGHGHVVGRVGDTVTLGGGWVPVVLLLAVILAAVAAIILCKQQIVAALPAGSSIDSRDPELVERERGRLGPRR